MRSPFTRTFARLALLATLLTNCAAASSSQHHPSAAPGYSVDVTSNHGNATAQFRSPGARRTVFATLPVPGTVQVIWLAPHLARITVPFGTSLSADWFESPSIAIGPLPGVIAVEPRRKLVAYSNGHTIRIARLGQHLIDLATVPIPPWCSFLACRYHTAFGQTRFSLSSRHHHLSEPIPRQ